MSGKGKPANSDLVAEQKKQEAEARRLAIADTKGKEALDAAKAKREAALAAEKEETAQEARVAAAMPGLNERGRKSKEKRSPTATPRVSATPKTDPLNTPKTLNSDPQSPNDNEAWLDYHIPEEPGNDGLSEEDIKKLQTACHKMKEEVAKYPTPLRDLFPKGALVDELLKPQMEAEADILKRCTSAGRRKTLEGVFKKRRKSLLEALKTPEKPLPTLRTTSGRPHSHSQPVPPIGTQETQAPQQASPQKVESHEKKKGPALPDRDAKSLPRAPKNSDTSKKQPQEEDTDNTQEQQTATKTETRVAAQADPKPEATASATPGCHFRFTHTHGLLLFSFTIALVSAGIAGEMMSKSDMTQSLLHILSTNAPVSAFLILAVAALITASVTGIVLHACPARTLSRCGLHSKRRNDPKGQKNVTKQPERTH